VKLFPPTEGNVDCSGFMKENLESPIESAGCSDQTPR
jgi:hypothetical protein